MGLTLGDIEGGAHSLLEIDFTQIAARAGLPAPRRQSFRLDAQGRRRWIDTDFDFFDVEVDGFVHLLPATYWDDMSRQNELVIAGRRLLRFSTVAVRLQEHVVASQLRRAYEAFRR
jgi:hypothetical protein